MTPHGVGSGLRLFTALILLATAQFAGAAAEQPYPAWAFPGPLLKSVAESKARYSAVQMYDRTAAVDWFPQSHPAMPAAVKGRLPLYACGFCHLPEGAGRPENAALAGMPFEYLKRQIDDFRSGARTTPDPKFGPATNMLLTIRHEQLSAQEAYDAARYYSGLQYVRHIKLIETQDVPHPAANAFVYVFDEHAPREPLGERIIEGPDDFERFEMRDPNVTLITYVPVGSISRGSALAKGDGQLRAACDSCHGPGLKGGPVGPPLAGRPVTPTFRQLRAFKTGTRSGQNAALMKTIVADLSQAQMIDLAAYVGSLNP